MIIILLIYNYIAIINLFIEYCTYNSRLLSCIMLYGRNKKKREKKKKKEKIANRLQIENFELRYISLIFNISEKPILNNESLSMNMM